MGQSFKAQAMLSQSALSNHAFEITAPTVGAIGDDQSIV